ncbi:ankyrin repeat-containing protein NPR4-like [Corylus avellana]|uniref:ankyrin repeat-containing protein NPR4-like n=1 Tax=Corylus avellana TaxID=13451 RepID=UPI00286CA437|nr:ankyrin repeat-containing protein NPR4-like [Corylus avellana]
MANLILSQPYGDYNHYDIWSALMESYLLAQDLWDIVQPTTEPPKPEDDVKAWTKKNAAALYAIQSRCNEDILLEIKGISSARTVWDKLATKYRPESSPEMPGQGDSKPDSLRHLVSHIPDDCLPFQSDSFSSPTSDSPRHLNSHISAENCSAVSEVLPKYGPLRVAIDSGDWDTASNFLRSNHDAKTARISVNGRRVLHVAVFAGHMEIVEELVQLLSVAELGKRDDFGLTALAQAVILQNIRMVNCMLRKNTNLLNIRDNENRIPLITALEFGNIKVARYLYSVSLENDQTLRDIDASTALTRFILLNNFDVALDLLNRYPCSAIAPNMYMSSPLAALASKSSAFPSGNQLSLWEKWIYACISIPSTDSTNDIQIDIHQSDHVKMSGSGIKKHLYEIKLRHHQARQLLVQMCSEVRKMDRDCVNEAILQAVKGGVVEFIDAIVKVDGRLLYSTDAEGRNLFFYAVLHRQAKIFSFIHRLDVKSTLITNALDSSSNTILHMVAMLEHSTERDRITGAALKMQSELRWFKDVEKVCLPWIHDIRNKTNMTAKELFIHNHKDMLKEGEKWMKATATSCMVVGALIITIMFTAAFTVPGGNNQNTGFLTFSDKKLFTAFIIFDALSLFSASTSVLIFLGMVTSRYAEDDFSRSLPLKMIIGHYTLFFSIATMMVAFCSGLFLMVPKKLWMVIPVICLASVTVIQFASMLFPLLVYMLKQISTYRLGRRHLHRLF